ncbi:uncharacterized protein PG998_012684 [Apiospora kogelbergensis]|uniref:Tetratricopeptide repeat-containing protein n=1 Tax=Apiospora kogelbergensis TaxID=1337665 RepID=A0AAW0QDY0_9PEZI
MARRNHKDHLKEAKPKPKKERKLETASDFEDAASEHEEAAGKWRAGDAAKSMRFFQRAIDTYDQGLKAFPQDLDLAYNKARIFLEVAEHPALLNELNETSLDWLQRGLEAHRYALNVDANNADTLFNTSQILTSIAEEIANDDDVSDEEAFKALQEAMDLQQRCLGIQEMRLQESLAQQKLAAQQPQEASTAPAGAESSTEQEASGEEYQDVTVIEPVTHETVIDTLLVQLRTLTTFCNVRSASSESLSPEWLQGAEERSKEILSKLQVLSQDQLEKLPEIALTKAVFSSALLEVGYRSGNLDAATYKTERDTVFAIPELKLEASHEALVDNARSLISFSSALAEVQYTDAQSLAILRWNALTESIKSLKMASEIQGIDNDEKSTSHMMRGDCSLQLHNLQYPPWSHQSAAANAAQFLKNALVFYRNAKALSADAREVAGLRAVVAEYISTLKEGQSADIMAVIKSSNGDPAWVMEQLEDMVADCVLPPGLFE